MRFSGRRTTTTTTSAISTWVSWLGLLHSLHLGILAHRTLRVSPDVPEPVRITFSNRTRLNIMLVCCTRQVRIANNGEVRGMVV